MKSYKREDFSTQNEVRWCPGCGDYAILMALQKALVEIGLPPEQHVFVSGIGCAGRLPYYMNCYGFHTIHGRATAVATGLKALREDLTVWVITGDGDALSIGANHLIHLLRRNVNVNVILCNNQIYGLTKGQFSPTSQLGQITKTSPKGVCNEPLNPLLLALASGASFVARAVDKDPAHLVEILKKAYEHPGCTFIEVYQDCNIFNHGAFDDFAQKTNRGSKTIVLEPGKPLLFGEEKQQALLFQGEDVLILPKEQAFSCTVHDPANFLSAQRLAKLSFPQYPVPLGIYYQKERPVYQLERMIQKSSLEVQALWRAKACWQVEDHVNQ